jgi:hypothetical protein
MSVSRFEPGSFMTERERSTNWAINHWPAWWKLLIWHKKRKIGYLFLCGPICRTLFDLFVYISVSMHINKLYTWKSLVFNHWRPFKLPILVFITQGKFLFTILFFIHLIQPIVSNQVCHMSHYHGLILDVLSWKCDPRTPVKGEW